MGDPEPPPKETPNFCVVHWRGVMCILIPLITSPLCFLTPKLAYMSAWVTLVMFLYWIFQIMPIGATALISIAMFPILSISGSGTICTAFLNDTMFMWMGSLAMAITMHVCNLDKHLAHTFISMFGISPSKMLIVIMLCALLLSMIIPNMVVTAILCPIAKEYCEELNKLELLTIYSADPPEEEGGKPFPSKVVLGFFLGIAYASTIGGASTMYGSATNYEALKQYRNEFPDANKLKLMSYFLMATPMMIISFIFVAIWLQIYCMSAFRSGTSTGKELKNIADNIDTAKDGLAHSREALGPQTTHQKLTLALIVLWIILLVTRDPIVVTGWGKIISTKDPQNSFVCMGIAFLAFMLPAQYAFCKYYSCTRPGKEVGAPSLIGWKSLNTFFHWDHFLMLGSGFAIVQAMNESKFDEMIVNNLHPAMSAQNCLLMVTLISFFLTTCGSNTANSIILTPLILKKTAELGIHPGRLTVNTILGLSVVFLFPVSAANNSIAAGWCNMRFSDMALAGIIPTIFILTVYIFGGLVLAPMIITEFNGFPFTEVNGSLIFTG